MGQGAPELGDAFHLETWPAARRRTSRRTRRSNVPGAADAQAGGAELGELGAGWAELPAAGRRDASGGLRAHASMRRPRAAWPMPAGCSIGGSSSSKHHRAAGQAAGAAGEAVATRHIYNAPAGAVRRSRLIRVALQSEADGKKAGVASEATRTSASSLNARTALVAVGVAARWRYCSVTTAGMSAPQLQTRSEASQLGPATTRPRLSGTARARRLEDDMGHRWTRRSMAEAVGHRSARTRHAACRQHGEGEGALEYCKCRRVDGAAHPGRVEQLEACTTDPQVIVTGTAQIVLPTTALQRVPGGWCWAVLASDRRQTCALNDPDRVSVPIHSLAPLPPPAAWSRDRSFLPGPSGKSTAVRIPRAEQWES